MPAMSTSSDYQAALDYLYSFIDFSRTRQENLAPENFDLSRMHALLASLGDPHRDYASIHVAGSKGKGSVSAFCVSVLHHAGYRVGLYTSPHLEHFCERIQTNQRRIPEKDMAVLIDEIKPHIAAVPGVTTFEITTALAFLFFARQQVEIAVFEVGLGGRLDATNVITPLVSTITSISLEHTAILGDTLAKIAGEKAGIIKPGVPVVSAPQESEAEVVLAAESAKQGTEFLPVDKYYTFHSLTRSLDGQTFRIEALHEANEIELDIPLLGSHQIENAVVAFAALQEAAKRGFPLKQSQIKEGFSRAFWPGRFEILHRDPFVIIDSAHNPESIRKLRLTLEEYLPKRTIVMVFGCSEDKDAAAMLAEIAPLCRHIIATRSIHPRAMQPQVIVDQVAPLGVPSSATADIESALNEATQRVPKNGVIMITGSVFVAGAGRSAWNAVKNGSQEV